jgi:hypothetical protein
MASTVPNRRERGLTDPPSYAAPTGRDHRASYPSTEAVAFAAYAGHCRRAQGVAA